MNSNFTSEDISEEIFQRSIRIYAILPLVGLIHYESMDDAWKNMLNNPGKDFSAILKERFGIDEKKYEREEDLAYAIMRKNDVGYIVCYELPIIQDIRGEGEHESYLTYGFGHCQRHCLYLEVVDLAGLNAVIDHAEANGEAMKARLRQKNKADKKAVAKG